MSKRVVFLFAICCLAAGVDGKGSIYNIHSMAQFPHHVTIRKTTEDGIQYCFGSILNPRWILTSSSCVSDGVNFELIFNRTNVDGAQLNSFSISVDSSAVYSKASMDGALIKLPMQLVFSDHIQPVSLLGDEALNVDGQVIVIPGKHEHTPRLLYMKSKVARQISYSTPFATHPHAIYVTDTLHPEEVSMNKDGSGVLIGWPENATLIALPENIKFGSTDTASKITNMMPWIRDIVYNGKM